MNDMQSQPIPSTPMGRITLLLSRIQPLPKAPLQRKVRRTLSFGVFLVIFVLIIGLFAVSLLSARQNGALYAATFAALVADQIQAENLLDPETDTMAAKLAVAQLTERLSNLTATTLTGEQALDSPGTIPQISSTTGTIPQTSPALGTTFLPGQNSPFRVVGQTDTASMTEEDFIRFLTRHAASFRIVWNDALLYESPNWEMANLLPAMLPEEAQPAMRNVFSLFSIASSAPLREAAGEGLVTVRIDPGLFGTYLFVLMLLVLLALLPLGIFTHLVGAFVARRVSEPVSRLVQQMDLLAGATPEAAADVPFTFRKPPIEIASIADSLHHIFERMKQFNATHQERTEQLARQGKELEEQNEILGKSRRQIQDAQSQMIQTQNLASIGQITAGISHEMNTPLGTIGSNVQLQEMLLDMLSTDSTLTGDPQMAAFLSEMKTSSRENARFCQSATDMVRSLKNFSRLDQADYQETDLNALIRNVVTLTTNLWKGRIRMHGAYGDILPAKCWPGLLNQLFMSLLTNAFEALPGEGDIWIRTSLEGMRIRVEVEDNGPGIPEALLDRIFEAGFSWGKKAPDGQLPGGMGLAMARDIVARHGGILSAKRGQFGGLLLCFHLPLDGGKT